MADGAMASRMIVIPIRDSKEVVEVSVDDLPEDASIIINILKDEVAPLEVWLDCALEYYKQGKESSFERILQEATDAEQVERLYHDQPEGRIKTLNALAGYYIEKAKSNHLDNEQKDEYHSKANQLIKTAEMTDQLHPTTFVSKGVMYLNQGEYQRAMTLFETALISDPNNIPALLGKACILYNQKNYEEALKLYQQPLRINGSTCPAAVRLGIGLCYYSLGNLKMARLAFERVLQLEDNANVLVALAILDLNSPPDLSDGTNTSNSHIEKAMKQFTRAYKLEPSNPMVLNHLANHFFYNNQMEKAQTLASNAYKNSQVGEVRAESCYHMARSYHVTGNYEAAFSYYYRIAMHQWPDFVLGRFGLGQMYLQRNELEKAMGEFQKVLKTEPDNFETNKILGALYAEKGKFDTALTYFQKAHSINPNDEQVLVEISKFEHHNPQAALDALLKAKRIMDLKKIQMPYELYSNLASLYHRMGDIKEAHNNAMLALEVAGIDLDQAMEMDISTYNLTLMFNVARILQDSHRTQHAKKLFTNILRNHISYYECYLALAMISHEEGNHVQALAYLKAATKLFPKEPVAYSAMGYVLMSQRNSNYNLAQKQYEHVLQKIDPKDGTALVALGTIYFNSATSSKNLEQDKCEKYLQYASDYFERALKYDPCNMYAALSLGAVMAQRGYLDDAREIFIKVQESSTQGSRTQTGIAETWLNLAHVWMCQKQYTNANKLYQKVLKTFYNNTHVPTLHCLAASLYDGRKLVECKSILQQAILLNPSDVNLWYDLAIAHHEYCVTITKTDRPTVKQAEEALNEIDKAKSLFEYVTRLEPSKLTTKAKGYVEYCTKTQKKANEILAQAKEDERKAEEVERQRREALEKQARYREFKKAEEERKKKQEEENQKRRAEELAERMNQLREQWNAAKPQKKDSDIADDEEEGGAGGKKRKRKSKKKAKDEEEEEEAQNSESDDGSKKKKKKKGGRLKKGKETKKPKKKKRRTDDEEEEEDSAMGDEAGGAEDDVERNEDNDNDNADADNIGQQEQTEEGGDRIANNKVNPEGEEEFQFE